MTRPAHTIAVVNSAIVPTAAMVTNRAALPGSPAESIDLIDGATREQDNVHLDALQLCEALFDDHMPANMLLIGAAYQHGVLPIAAGAIEHAIRLNGAAVDTTIAAFRWGRAAALDRDRVQAAVTAPAPATVDTDPAADALAAGIATGDLRSVLATRIADLTGFQSRRYARRYAEDVQQVTTIARARAGTEASRRIGLGYAQGLHKLMAYKDEYEGARLHLDSVEKARRDQAFGPDATVSVLLHPPILRALGMHRKIRLTRSAGPAFRILRGLRRVRGTKADLFGYTALRRVERYLIDEYQAMVHNVLEYLDEHDTETISTMVELVEFPQIVRGYEDIKLANIVEFRERAEILIERVTGTARQ